MTLNIIEKVKYIFDAYFSIASNESMNKSPIGFVYLKEKLNQSFKLWFARFGYSQ